MLFCSMLPASFFFTEHRHLGNRWSLCAKEICYRNVLLGAFFQSGKTLPIQVRRRRWLLGREVRVAHHRLPALNSRKGTIRFGTRLTGWMVVRADGG